MIKICKKLQQPAGYLLYTTPHKVKPIYKIFPAYSFRLPSHPQVHHPDCPHSTSSLTPEGRVSLRFSAPRECRSECVREVLPQRQRSFCSRFVGSKIMALGELRLRDPEKNNYLCWTVERIILIYEPRYIHVLAAGPYFNESQPPRTRRAEGH